MRAPSHRLRSEHGAVFVQVGLAILVLMAFNVFVLDYGIMWIGRRQAQNAADAGALAGAVARAYDENLNRSAGAAVNTVVAGQTANAVVGLTLNRVWQQAATTTVTQTCPAGVTGSCLKVTVYRNGQNASASLPMFFGGILGLSGQGVIATATAVIGPANTTKCLKPWALPDKWREYGTGALPNAFSEFNHDTPTGTVPTPDSYVRPDAGQATTLTMAAYGELRQFDTTSPVNDPITLKFLQPLDLPGGHTYTEDMTSCNGQPITIGQRIPIDTGVNSGVFESSLTTMYNSDASADYHFEGGYVVNSCAPSCAALSPRLMAVALFDPDDFDFNRKRGWPLCPGARPCVLVANIAGFFIDYISPVAINGRHGHFLRYPGTTLAGSPTIIDDGSWLVEPHLIR